MADVPQANDLIELALPVLEARHAEFWLVGGWVRDYLLGRPTHDVDFVMPEGAIATARQVSDAVGGAFVVLDVERDTARVVVGPPGASIYMDFAGLRGPTLDADLWARDFTVNAMAVPAEDWQAPEHAIIDPTGGRADLREGLLRAVTPEAFREDPLRMLRAVRLGAGLGFEIESQTAAWIYRDAELLDAVSRERVRDELAQLLGLPGVAHSLRQLEELRLLGQVMPEVDRLGALPLAGRGGANVLEHSVTTVDLAEKVLAWLGSGRAGELNWPGQRLEEALGPYREHLNSHMQGVLPGGRSAAQLYILAALLHDVGKGAAIEGSSEGRLLNHEVLGASIAATIMRRLCFSSAETVRVRLSVRNHMRPGQLVQEGEAPSRRAIYRFFRDTEPAGPDTILLSLADHLATRGPALDPDHWRRHLSVSRALLHAYYEERHEIIDPHLVIDGHSLMTELNLAPGPRVGALLDSIREAQAAGEVSTREQALSLARDLMQRNAPLRDER